MASAKSVIYETSGRAREYNELAINLFDGCSHHCAYCYAPLVTKKSGVNAIAQFFNEPKPRVTPADIEKSAWAWVKKHGTEFRPILLCFTCDPYQPVEAKTKLTRTAIEILGRYGMKVTILTKGGKRALRDFDLLGPGDAFATTLTCVNLDDSATWEPGAADPDERIEALVEAHKLGIETWVSLEPVLYPSQTKTLIAATKDIVGHFKVGMLNYHKHADTIDWKAFGWDIKEFMDRLGVKYYIKKDLLYAMGLWVSNAGFS
jgi:DNA repair photolyase